MFRKRKKKRLPPVTRSQKSDFAPDCEHDRENHEFVEREVDGYKFVASQCKECGIFGRRPIGFVFKDEGSIPIPDFDTLDTDTETELYYKLNYLSQIFPNRKTRILIAKTKYELKKRFDALKYDDPNEGTREHWLENDKIRHDFLKELPECSDI